MKIIKLIKLQELPDALHPNNIDIGQTFEGTWVEAPTIGERFELRPISDLPGKRGVTTSGVQEILPNNTFRTYSSIYKWEEI